MRPDPIPLTVLTGFLGAGKTTLLNRWLADPALADTVVIVNEFGEVGIDHLLIEVIDEDMVLLGAGCLCCTVRGDLIATLEDLLRKRDNGRIAPFRRVVIETTGLADPAPILHALIEHPYLVMRYRLQAVVTVIDALHGQATLDAHPEAVRQVAVADRLVLAKADLVPDAAAPDPAAPDPAAPDPAAPGTAALRARLARLNPGAPVLAPDTPPEALLGGLFGLDGRGGDKGAEVRAWLGVGAAALSPDTNAPDVNRHDAAIRAVCLTSAEPVPRPAFEMFMDLLRSGHGAKLLRLKGVVALADDPGRPLVVHGVRHVFHAPLALPAWPDPDRTSRLVLILSDLDPAFVERLWDAFLGRPRLDAPDAAALTANPLAIPGG